ncbi:MAG TPA: hypothetical protein O0X70_04485 [Methanocorpusculum sp.]|nr:hypothetical protein [Methanocorpusculum sp.]
MGFTQTTAERLRQRELLETLICSYGIKITNENGEIIGYRFFKDLDELTPYQCWYFVRRGGKFPKRAEPPKGFVVPANSRDWIISLEESLAREAAKKKKTGKKSGKTSGKKNGKTSGGKNSSMSGAGTGV